MIKAILFASIFTSQMAMATPKMLCSDSGDMNGSYFLDITGHEGVLGGKVQSITRNLGFKHFRSFIEPISDLICTKPNAYLDGPRAVLACRSGMVNDYGPTEPVFEAVVYQGAYGLEMNVAGPGISPAAHLPCQLKD